MLELRKMSAAELGYSIRTGEIRVGEAVESYLGHIRETEPGLHAFLTVEEEKVMERAAQVEEGIRSGRYKSSLAGVPVAVKDNICTKGVRTTCASKMLENYVPSYNADVIEKMEEAGMILLGKTNMDEFAMGSTTETSAFCTTVNPWDQSRVPGGSSGGSCAAVAAGEAPLALGSDTGGSIRQPCGFCGVTGLKPTYGTVSRYGLVAYASSLDQIGPIGKNAGDCEELLSVIAGADPKDSTSSAREPEPASETGERNLQGVRIGIAREYLGEGIQEDVKKALQNTMDCMRQGGAKIEWFSLGMTEYTIPVYYIIACAEASSNLERFDGVKYGYRAHPAESLHEMMKKSRSEGFGEEVKRRILLGAFVLSAGYYDAYYLKALKVKGMIRSRFDQAFQKYDCILAPASPVAPPKLGTSLQDPLKMYLSDICTVAVNLAGLPAVSLPCGMDSLGLPIGMQLIGNRFWDRKLLHIAQIYETMRGPFAQAWERGKKDGKTV